MASGASTNRRTYLDHAAQSPLREAAREAWLAACQVVGNPSGLHGSARAARRLLEDSREQLATDLGAHPSELIVTSGGSEADSIAVLGTLRASDRERLAVSAVEHPAVLQARELDPATDVLPVDRHGVLDLDAARVLIDERHALVSVQTVNNEQGTLQPVDEVATLAHDRGAAFHTDAVQALLWPGVDFAASPADLLTLTGHKVGAPVGVGLLLARRSASLAPVSLGGGQERAVRSGTIAVALVAALAAAVHDLVEHRDDELQRTVDLGRRVRALVGTLDGVRLTGPGDERAHPGIVSMTFEGLRADDLLLLLDRAGIDASVGSACRAGVSQPSEVVLACGGTLDEALSTVRLSLGHTTTAADIDHLAAVLPGAVAQARRVD